LGSCLDNLFINIDRLSIEIIGKNKIRKPTLEIFFTSYLFREFNKNLLIVKTIKGKMVQEPMKKIGMIFI